MNRIVMSLAAGAVVLLLAACAGGEPATSSGPETAAASDGYDETESPADRLRSWGGQHSIGRSHSRR